VRPRGPAIRICILSRKHLGRVTRVVRQAQTLCAAGHTVTVVCRTRPVDELLVTVPQVEWVEIETEPWTRGYVGRLHGRMQERRLRDRRRRHTPGLRGRLLRALTAAENAFRGVARVTFLAFPGAILLRDPGESLRSKFRELRPLNESQLAHTLLRPFGHKADSASFGEKACHALAERPFDICQAHDNYALIAALTLAKHSRGRLIYDAVEISEHRSWMNEPRCLLERIVDRRDRRAEAAIIKRDAAAVITIGDGLAEWYARRYRIRRPIVVRNCRAYWHGRRRDDIRRDCGLGAGQSLVVWVGYPYPQQGVDAIVDAASASDPDIHFGLVGDAAPSLAAYYDSVRRRADAQHVSSQVHFLPGREPNELIGYLSGADLGIIPIRNAGPNLYYCLPNKFMEMVMARLPLAVSNLADMRAVVERYRIGGVFDVEDPASIAATVDALLAPGRHARLREAVDRAAAELCWENEGVRYLGVVNAVAATVAA
jgi:glycosyltransferase involved in cell wall biosynthesis